MTGYEEVCDAAKKATQDWQAYRRRACNCFESIVDGLKTSGGVPADKIALLRWNEQTGNDRYYLPYTAGKSTFSDATLFDPSGGYWHVGIEIAVGPSEFIRFPICMREQNGGQFIKLGINYKPRQLDFKNRSEIDVLIVHIVMSLMQAYQTPGGSQSRKIGFGVGSLKRSVVDSPLT